MGSILVQTFKHGMDVRMYSTEEDQAQRCHGGLEQAGDFFRGFNYKGGLSQFAFEPHGVQLAHIVS